MEIPYRLTRREQPAAAEAYLLPSTQIDALIRSLLAQSRLLATVFRVRGGFLILPPNAGEPIPGAIQLRRLAGDFFIPVDADLTPALLPDELVGLTTSHGLIFLPSGEKLAFDPKSPLQIESCFRPLPVKQREWKSFPARPYRPEELKSLRGPEPSVGAVLEIGRPDDGDPLPGSGEGDPENPKPIPEDARPPAGTFSQRLKAGMKLRLGQFLNWVGKQTNLPGLSRAGGDMARKALEAVPRLSEKVLGDQEAALREVLRQLREGDVEQGLRRAPIAVGDPDAPAPIATGADLGTRDPRFSLRDLIFSGGRGTTWLGGGDVWHELAKEYRRLAEEAVKRGDFRRAAYLYGVLLRDLHSAANILLQGGLHRDAAILYRDRLKNLPAAAAAFEAAGDFEEALRLHLHLNDFEAAAKLFCKMGYEADAREMYRRAAFHLASQGKLEKAGQMMRWQAHDRDSAMVLYREGWTTPHAETVNCGQRLLEELLEGHAWDDTQALLDQAEEMLRGRGKESGTFFNHALGLEEFFPPKMRSGLKDRVRLHFADQIEKQSESSIQARTNAEQFFGQKDHWSGSVLRDAVYAANRHRPKPHDEPKSRHLIRVVSGTVRAVAVARGTFDLVIASDTEIQCWRPDSGKLQGVSYFANPRLGLAVDSEAKHVYLLTAEEREGMKVVLKSWSLRSTNTFHIRPELILGDGDGRGWILAPAPFLHEGSTLVPIMSPTLQPHFAVEGMFVDKELDSRRPHWGTVLYAEWPDRSTSRGVWKFSGHELVLIRDFADPNRDLCCTAMHFCGSNEIAFVGPFYDWLLPSPDHVEMVGLMDIFCIWVRHEAGEDRLQSTSAWLDLTHRWMAVCLVRPGLVAAVDNDNVLHWLRPAKDQLVPVIAPTPLELPSRVVFLACRPQAREIIAVLEDGNVTRVDLP